VPAPFDSSADSAAVRVRVPAKINLHLGVGPVRADGYHELRTVFQALDLTDEVIARPSDVLRLTVTGTETDDVPDGPENLAWRAAELLADHIGGPPRVHLELNKSIPVAGGMAGGSADAAGALLACAELWQIKATRTELAELAAQLGSDVAFSLAGGTALGTGRGELLAPVLATGTFWWTLAIADFGLSTPEVFREFDLLLARGSGVRPRGLGPADDVLDAVRSGDVGALARALSNDLQAPALALAPSLRRTLAAGTELGALASIVSGSGPTCAFLTDGQPAATQLAAALTAEGVCRTTRVASGPAPGARVVH
jgi:4-diphosphocytidyl-2-C-methyl-D-erythritol kinase